MTSNYSYTFAGQNFQDMVRSKLMLKWWFLQQAVNFFYDCEIEKLAPTLNKCLDNDGDYVEK